ncbi:MAG: T9SS type A sorting domain-containing protein [Saprospiraceae bacterium]|nr:T9SS type A sorting domain-containing protein [Saprospiraceae bacterium]
MKFDSDHFIKKGLILTICVLLILLHIDANAQAGSFFGCLFDVGCEYEEVSSSRPSVVLNDANKLVSLNYCEATEDQIKEVFQDWTTNLIDPSTNCRSIRMIDFQTEVLAGRSFTFEDIPFPEPCGGTVHYSFFITGDCDREVLSVQEAQLTIEILIPSAGYVPDDVSISTCNMTNDEILAAYADWVAEFDDPLVYEPGHPLYQNFGSCGPTVNYGGNASYLRLLLPGGATDLADFRTKLGNGLKENDIMNGVSITGQIIHDRNFASCGNIVRSSTFEVIDGSPPIIASASSPTDAPACFPIDGLFRAFLNSFTYNVDEVASCPGTQVNEIFIINDDHSNPLSRSEVEFIEYCGGEITIQYFVENADNRNIRDDITRTFRIKSPSFLEPTTRTICSGEQVDTKLDLKPLYSLGSPIEKYKIKAISSQGLIPGDNNTMADANQLIDEDAIVNDVWVNLSNQSKQLIYEVTPMVDCTPTNANDPLCEGEPGQVILFVKPLECPSDIVINEQPDQCGAFLMLPSSSGCGAVDFEIIAPPFNYFPLGSTSIDVRIPGISAPICSFNVNVEDFFPPQFTNCPVDVQVQCLEDVSACDKNDAEAFDCAGFPTITCDQGVLQGGPCGGTVTRTYTATDESGQTSTCIQRITIDDTDQPTIQCPSDTTIFVTLECQSFIEPESTRIATATDNCTRTTDILISRTDQITPRCGSTMVITRTWTATDDCGNTSICDQIITLVDTISPLISCPPSVQLYADETCEADTSAIETGFASATDNCQQLEISRSDVVEIPCEGEMIINRTWTAIDPCGNSRSCQQTIVVSDTTSPVISCPPSKDLGCNPQVPLALANDVSASDQCSTPLLRVVQGQPLHTGGSSYQRTDTYMATDGCGNSSTCSRTLTWKEDLTVPEIRGVPANQSISCMGILPSVPTNVKAMDNSDGVLEPLFEEEVFEVSCGGRMVRRSWTAVDECGNEATEHQIISLVDDVAPVLSVPGDTTIELGDAVPEASYQVNDQCSDVRVSMKEIRREGDPGEYRLERSWIARDACGNTAQAQQLIHVEDRTPPEITIVNPMLTDVPNGGSMEIFDCAAPNVAMADAFVIDANTEVSLVTFDKLVASNVCSVFGYYRRWKCGYIATDGAGNETEYSFTVLQYDTNAPILMGVPADLALSCEDLESGALTEVSANDACQGSIPVDFHELQLLNPSDSSQAALIRTWTATDGCGNAAQASQAITFCGFDLEMAASSLGNRVWLDANENGLQDEGEEGIDDVKVNLFWIDPMGGKSPRMIDTIRTSSIDNKPGQFHFDYLFPGNYQIEIELPEGLTPTQYKMGESDSLDSDIELPTAMSAIVEIDTYEVYRHLDIGLVPAQQSTSPVSLKLFQGSSEKCQNRLTWETDSEASVRAFELQASSDGTHFATIKRFEPLGGINQGASYRANDAHPSQRNRYRLKTVGLNGTKQYSEIILVDLECNPGSVTDLLIYPNPTHHLATVHFENDRSMDMRISVLDHLGRIIRDEIKFVHKGQYVQQIDLHDQPDGIYWVKISLGKELLTRKLVKTQ